MNVAEIKEVYPDLESFFESSRYGEDFSDDQELEVTNHLSYAIPGTDFIVAPYEGFNFEEGQVYAPEVSNLTKVKHMEIMGGPSCFLYKKTNPDMPAFLLYKYCGEKSEYLLITVG